MNSVVLHDAGLRLFVVRNFRIDNNHSVEVVGQYASSDNSCDAFCVLSNEGRDVRVTITPSTTDNSGTVKFSISRLAQHA